MKRKIFLTLMSNILILSAILSFLPLKVGATSSMKIIGYVAGDDPHGYINSLEYTKYTHIIFCQIGVTSSTDPTLVYRAGNSTSLKSFKTKAQAAGCKFMVCLIGGNWGQESYPYPLTAIMNNSTYRAQLATNLANFVAANGLDGVDIDWEDDNIVQANYNSFLSSLRSALPAGKIISVCGTAEWANPSNQWFSVSAVNTYVDFVNLMMYGTHPYPEWSKLADAETYTQEWLNAGFNPAQLLLGITTQAIDSTRKATDYSNVVANLNPTNDVDSYTQTPPWSCGSFTVGGTGELWWGGYNLAQSKADYASSKNLGGIALYVANEDACGNVKSLIDAVVQGGINGNTPPPPVQSNPAQSNFGYGSTGVYNNGDTNCMFFSSDMPSSNGVATSVTVYVANYGANAKVKCAYTMPLLWH